MEKQNTENIGTAIMENGNDAIDWAFCGLSCELYWWTEFFNIAFFKTQPVKMPVLSFEKKSVRNLGHYVKQRNGFGLKENININRCHLDRPLWEILAVLIHEMCHSWQNLYGKPFHFVVSQQGVQTQNVRDRDSDQQQGSTPESE